MKRLLPALAGSVLVFAAGCESGSTAPVERITTHLECNAGNDQYIDCELTLEETAAIEIELLDRNCTAIGNTVRILTPVEETLTTDGCRTPVLGTLWSYPGPFGPGTNVAMEFVAPRLNYDPGMRVEGEYPTWTLFFEDGGDQDFYDLVMEVRAVVID